MVLLKQLDGFQGDAAGEGVAHEGRAVHQRFPRVVVVEAVVHLPVGHGDRVADITAGQRFAEYEDVREDQIRHKPVPGSAEAGGHFVEDQQDAVLVAKLSRPLQERKIVHAHAAGSLQKRFHDQAVQLFVPEPERFLEGRDSGGNVDHMRILSVSFQDKMIIFVVARFHGFKRIAVVGVGQREDLRPPHLSTIDIILKRHFQGDLHCHAPGVGKEAVVKIARKPALQPCGKLLHRFVSQAAQHYMGETVRLFFDSRGQHGMSVAVDDAPPGRDGVDHSMILRIEPDALRVRDVIRFVHGFHLLIRIPDHALPPVRETAESPGSLCVYG